MIKDAAILTFIGFIITSSLNPVKPKPITNTVFADTVLTIPPNAKCSGKFLDAGNFDKQLDSAKVRKMKSIKFESDKYLNPQ